MTYRGSSACTNSTSTNSPSTIFQKDPYLFGLHEFPPLARTMYIYLSSTFSRVCRVGIAKGFRTLYNCTQYAYAPFVLLLYFLNSILMYSLCILNNSGTEGNSCKANSCYTNSAIFERASEIFSCKPNKYGSF